MPRRITRHFCLSVIVNEKSPNLSILLLIYAAGNIRRFYLFWKKGKVYSYMLMKILTFFSEKT